MIMYFLMCMHQVAGILQNYVTIIHLYLLVYFEEQKCGYFQITCSAYSKRFLAQ